MGSIGKYEITGELGTGGFGRVYKALDPTVGRVVAIKVLNVQDDPTLAKRFRAEAMTSANLRHKNIVTIYEFGEDDGRQFLVMEYLDGKDLHRLIKEGPPTPMLAKLLVMSEVSQGLRYAHIHGVVHRDVKPANIMWLSDGTVKIMDFGIARLMLDANSRLTQTGCIIGTPQYMAPEQFTSDTADAQCDIWAYGVVLYEFLSGTNPFDAVSAPQIIYRVTTQDPSLVLLLPEQPGGLIPLLKRLLSKSREDRYPSMEEVRFDLELVIRELKQAQVESLVRNAGALIQGDRLSEALSLVSQILDLDQSNVQAYRWRRELTDRIRVQSLQRRVKELVEQAETEASVREYGAAADRLEEALRLDVNNSSVRVRLEQIRSERERTRRAASLVAEARLELQNHALTAAFEHASEAASADPHSEAAIALLDEVRREMERRELETRRKGALSRARGLVLVQDYAGAAAVLQDFAEHHPADSEIEANLEETKGLAVAQAAQLKVDAAILDGKEMIRRGSYRRAIEILLGINQQNPEVSGLLKYAREQLEAEAAAARQRDEDKRHEQEAVDSAIARVGALVEAKCWDEGLAEIERELSRHPESPRLLEGREYLVRQKVLREAIANVRELLARGEVLAAMAAIDTALKTFPDEPRLVQLRQEAQRALRQRTPETPAIRTQESRFRFASTDPDRRRMVVIGACVLVAVGLAVPFLLRGPSRPQGVVPNVPAAAPLKQDAATVPQSPAAPPLEPAPEPKAAAPKAGKEKKEPKRTDARKGEPDVVPLTPKPTAEQLAGPPQREPLVVSLPPKPPAEPVQSEGRIVWTGDLDTGQEIDLGSISVSGSVSGSLPGVPVTVEVHPNTVRVVSQPGTENGWRHLVLHNDGKKQVMILVKWTVANK